MSTRLSLLLLAGAFALLCGIVLSTLRPTDPLQTQADADRLERPHALLPILPASRTAPKLRCNDLLFSSDCSNGQPAVRPAATQR